MDFVYLVASFAVILAGALLFTNAVEWIGHRLKLGEGAVGSLLAAVGTAMPETLIAVVALIGASKSEDVAVGAIVGAPFLLATLAMGLVGLVAYLYRDRREQGIELRAHVPTLDRDLFFFLVFFGLALALGFGAPDGLRFAAGIVFLLAYVVYVWRTLARGGEAQPAESAAPAARMIRASGSRCFSSSSDSAPWWAARTCSWRSSSRWRRTWASRRSSSR
jgi:cation:H+ antiporter